MMFLRSVMALWLCVYVSLASAADNTWLTSLGGAFTARDGVAKVFRHGSFHSEGFVLGEDKTLRIPGTTKERVIVPAGTTLGAPESILVRSADKRFHLLMWKDIPEGEFAVLAVFPDGSAEPTDVVSVKEQRETYLGKPMALDTEDAFLITNAHLSAGEDHVQERLFRLRDARFSLIAELSKGSSGGCPAYRESSQWSSRAGNAGARPTVAVAVELVINPSDFSDCGKKEIREKYEDTYKWDASSQRYVFDNGTISRLQAREDQLGRQAAKNARSGAN